MEKIKIINRQIEKILDILDEERELIKVGLTPEIFSNIFDLFKIKG